MIAKTIFPRLMTLILPLYLGGSMVFISCKTRIPEGSLERNKELVCEMNAEVWNKTNLEIVDKLFAPDFVMHFLPDGSELRGVDSLRLHILEHHKAFPDWSENIIQIVAEGDLVVIHYISTGTNKGRWLLPDLFSMQQQLAGTGKE